MTIYRPGLITGDSATGIDSAAAGQFFYSLVRGCLEMGVAPSWSGNFRIVPVDHVGRAVASVALHSHGWQGQFAEPYRRHRGK